MCDFLLTGKWISFARHKVPAVRKFVVIRTARGLFSYTNFEPATALFDLNQSTTKLFNKKYPVWGIFIKTGCARCAVLELITTWI